MKPLHFVGMLCGAAAFSTFAMAIAHTEWSMAEKYGAAGLLLLVPTWVCAVWDSI
jgi:hypothetical protein